MNKKIPQRVVITTKDIQNIPGKGERSAKQQMQKLGAILKKVPGQYVTVTEFCELVGLTDENVREFF